MLSYELIKITNIPDFLFDGYFWFSDAEKPQVIIAKKIDKSIFSSMPFAIEANFYAPKEQVSIQARNIDGDYQIIKFSLKGVTEKPLRYIGHDLEKEGKKFDFLMLEAWEEVEDQDNLLEAMKTLQPTWAAFAGFTDKTLQL